MQSCNSSSVQLSLSLSPNRPSAKHTYVEEQRAVYDHRRLPARSEAQFLSWTLIQGVDFLEICEAMTRICRLELRIRNRSILYHFDRVFTSRITNGFELNTYGTVTGHTQ